MLCEFLVSNYVSLFFLFLNEEDIYLLLLLLASSVVLLIRSIIHMSCMLEKSFCNFFIYQKFFFCRDVKLLVNMDSTSHGNPLVVSEEIVTTAESDITGLFVYPYVTVPDE